MNKETRIQKIQEIIDRDKKDPFGKMEIPWDDKLETKDVYKIPLQYLVYNKYNGRILSRTKSLETQSYNIDVESEEGKKKIEGLLWESKIDRNKKTLESLKGGQQKVGIITKDGVIIDGNRRAMLLNKLNPFGTFKAVVLDVTLEENPIQIEKLETSYQMGEDAKVDYNATEKYIKSKVLYTRLTQKEYSKKSLDAAAIKEIANWMGKSSPSIVEDYLNTMEVMDEYLRYYDYDGIYTQLDDREDQFLNLTKWLNSFYDKESGKAFDGYTNGDVDDLKTIAFDYIRIRPEYDGKEFRYLADGKKESHFFGNKGIWKSFSEVHFEKQAQLPQEQEIDFSSANLKKHLDDRDAAFFEASQNDDGESFLLENLDNHKYKLRDNEEAGKPEKLVKRAVQTLDAIKTGHPAFALPEVQEKMEDLGTKVLDMLQKRSPLKALSQVISLLEKLDKRNIPNEDIAEVRQKIQKIQQLGDQLNNVL
jgi:hypothetical protein